MATSGEFKLSLENIKLEELTTITLSTEVLRTNFEIILHALKNFGKKLDSNSADFKNSNNETNNYLNQLKIKLEELEKKEAADKHDCDGKIGHLQDSNKHLEQKVADHNNEIIYIRDELSKLKDGVDHLKNDSLSKTDLTAIKDKLDHHDQLLQELMDKIKNQTGGSSSPHDKGFSGDTEGVDKNLVEKLMDEIRDIKRDLAAANYIKTADFNLKIGDLKADLMNTLGLYATKKELEEFSRNTNSSLQAHQHSIDDLYKLIRNLEEKMNGKVDCDSFDAHIEDYNRMKNILINLANSKALEEGTDNSAINQLLNSSSGPSMSTKDANFLKELATKFPELEAIVKKLLKDFNEHQNQYKHFVDDTNKKTSVLDQNHTNFKNDATKRIQALEDLLKQLQDSIKLMQERLDSQKGGSSTTSKDLKVVSNTSDLTAVQIDIKRIQAQLIQITDVDKEQDAKLVRIFDDLSEIKQIKIKLNGLNDYANENRSRIVALEEELNDLRVLKQRIESLEQSANRKPTKKLNENDIQQKSGADLEEVKKLIHEAIEKLRMDLMRLIEELRDLIGKKVDAEDLWKSESTILEKLDQVAGALIKRLADKADTKKALLFLEKKIKDITVLIFGDPTQGEDGAMFAKKPWAPWACASCDSKLNKYPGALVDHKNWNKMPPAETSPERISQGKFGKGWSKWVDKKATQSDKMRETQKDDKFRSTIDSLPEIHPKDETKNSGR
jgi:chromosome segregation ATPase